MKHQFIEYLSRLSEEAAAQGIKIASSNAPSSAFKEASQIFLPKSQLAEIGFAKAVRWLAVLRRDEGESAFMAAADEIRRRQTSWHLADGTPVIDRWNSHLATHLKAYPFLGELLPQALAQITSDAKDFYLSEVDMGKVVGKSICVATTERDTIIFAQRPNRKGLTRFVESREPEECSKISVVLKKGDGYYILLSAFVGGLTPPEPWDKFANPESLPFWNSHALIWGHEEVLPGTETRDYPW